jgi:polysaccharide pyruvyl transferase WcaK-like protein
VGRRRILHFHFRPKHNVGDAAVVLAVRQLLDAPLGHPRWTSRPIKDLRRADPGQLLRLINSHDLVVVGGGGLFSRWGLPVNNAVLEGVRPPLVVFGAGLNRNVGDGDLDPAQMASAVALGRKAAAVSVRDQATADWLAAIGVPAVVTGDPALFLAGRRPWWFRATGELRIGVNLAAHGWAGQDQHLDRALGALEAVMGELATRPGAQFYYLRHTDREEPLARRLRTRFPGLRICRQDAAGLHHVYGHLDLVISMMLHSAILAAGNGVPVVNMAYDAKNSAFLRDLGHPGWSLPVETVTAEGLRAVVNGILADGNDDPFGPALARFRESTEAFVARVTSLL